MRLLFSIILSLLAVTTAWGQCAAPTAADAGKLCMANADGTSSWTDAIVVNPAASTITNKYLLEQHHGMICHENNDRCLSQRDAFGVEQNLLYLDKAQNIAKGPGHDRGVSSFISLVPENFFLNETKYEWEGTSWPLDKLSVTPIGSGCTMTFGGSNNDNNVLLTAPASAGDGCIIMSTNRKTNTSYSSHLKFLFDVDDDSYIDLQFGLTDKLLQSGLWQPGVNQIRFRVGNGSNNPGVLSCALSNGGTHQITTTWTRGTDRRAFDLYFPSPTQSAPDNLIAFLPANSNNESLDAPGTPCNFALNDSALPSGSANLYMFLKFRNYDPLHPRTLRLGKMVFRSGF